MLVALHTFLIDQILLNNASFNTTFVGLGVLTAEEYSLLGYGAV
jgi:hypothetical protein